MSILLCTNDDTFGPGVRGCRGDFDFTQVFEKIILSILPSTCFAILAGLRLTTISRRPRIIDNTILQNVKVVLLTGFSATQISILAVLAKSTVVTAHSLSLAAAGVGLFASLFSIWLSCLEHSRSLHLSRLLESYLFLTLLLDIVQCRTLWLSHQTTLAKIFTASVAIKAINFCLEVTPKSGSTRRGGEQRSPEEAIGIISLGTYSWLISLLVRGYRGIIAIDDLCPLNTSLGANNLYNNLTLKWGPQGSLKRSQYGLVKDVTRALLGPFLYPVVPRLALVGFKLCQPLFIQSMLDYLATAEEDRDRNHGYGLIGAAFLIYTGIAISSGIYQYYNQQFVYMLRSSLHTAIFRKTTQMSQEMTDDSAAITLMSTDLDRIVQGVRMIHEIWAILAQVGLGCWLLYGQLGVAFISPIIVIAVCSVLLMAVTRLVDKRLVAWMAKIQNRVGITAAAISQMKSYKISGLAEIVGTTIQSLRETEIRVGLKFRWLVICTITLGAVPSVFSPVIAFAATSNSILNVSTIFTSYGYILLVTAPFTIIFNCFPSVLAALTCMQRIQKFLDSDPRIDFRCWISEAGSASNQVKEVAKNPPNAQEDGLAFKIERGSFGWSPGRPVLANITCDIPAKSLTIIIGQVASGKSTLCRALLGEVPIYSGKVSVFFPHNSSLGYCQQEPFLYKDTLKNNIVGRSKFSQERFDEVVAATLLNADISTFPRRSNTMMGSSGSTLSGGQKQRVAIARALYSGAKVLVFDDALSGLDASTASMLFQRVFGPDGFIKRNGVTAVLCTHSIGYLPAADHVIVLTNNGTKAEQGSFGKLRESSEYVKKLDIKVDVKQSQEASALDTTRVDNKNASARSSLKPSLNDSSRALGDWTVYKHWFKNVRPLSTASLLLFAMIHGFSSNFATVWLSYWSQDTFNREASFYVGIYALLQAMFIISWVASAIEIFISMTAFAGSALHKQALTTLITAPLRFLTSTDIGVTINHFSQDLTLIDGELLFAFFFVALNSTEALGMLIVIATAAPFLAVGFPVLLAVLYFVQRFYLRTSRQLRLLDLEAKSPLYTHFLDTMRGIATVRAFGWVAHGIEYNDKLLDNSLQPAYLLAAMQQWLRVVMQLLVAGLALVIVSLATQLNSNVGRTGTSLVTLLSFGNSLAELVQSYTDLETCIGAVSRLKTFTTSVKPEDRPTEDMEPPETWPSSGAIELRNVSASYKLPADDVNRNAHSGLPQSSLDLVIRDLSLNVPPGQKLAVCGRTGSGKSTLMLLLLRLLDPLNDAEETMVIDHVPICRVKRGTLRKRIIALSQGASLLPDGCTIKLGIDPFGKANENECMSALEMVGLAHFAEDRGGLEACMGVDDLSMGQRQLFCLGRAIVRKLVKDRKTPGEKTGGILLLDEVSSSVDYDTDRRIHEIVKAEFINYTVIGISHRLETVVDYFDRVIVLDGGRLVESGVPQDLATTPSTYFGELWKSHNK
ncbi:P-loop containing nucleoside triphosphate hydrolase protein [Lindgomyces ingoldianus]|uniref:P-loop containing nucleoside triphosphate hydrolase protein n=1 Tax=Lindgomyces ingoldianus TaxID=673940 RepID=A0ACB6QXH1_9PLEO|nr:P-loop containing nucleoside triphosphate hydrolase protein [Lindgomyces ingoldianus]KAF2470780.1 P-loop containing nucleoside triphosphate hydrolase protein [Lindgomyces ingoldianus]